MSDSARPSRSELVARAREVAQRIHAHEAESHELRSLHPESVKAISEAGLFKVMQPRRIGGYEQTIPVLHEVARTLGSGCISAAWVYMVMSAHIWCMGMFPEEAQDEVASDDPETRLPGTLASMGKAVPVEGGFRVSGQWQFASGCDHSRWGMFCAMQTDSTREDPKHIHFFAPAHEYEIVDTWHVLGLRGSGSKDIAIDDVFIPTHRTVSTGTLFSGESPHAFNQATRVYRYPVLPVLTYWLTAPCLAMAQRIYDNYVEATTNRRDRYDGSHKSRKATMQMRIAESWAELQAAEAFVDGLGRTFDRAMEEDQDLSVDERVEVKWRAAYAIRLCRRSADRIFDAAGANHIYDRSPILPIYESLQTLSHHAAADFDNNGTSFGSVVLGNGPGTVLV